MPSTTFKFTPLLRPKQEIRLLKLQPDKDVIRLNIQVHDLEQSPSFVALSYEWGDDEEAHDIDVDGTHFKIRQNLYAALEHVRTLQADQSSTRLFEEDAPHFWIDAISIDQANESEKSDQVAMMGSIFSQASHVIAWIGIEEDDSALAMRSLNQKIGDQASLEAVAVRMLCRRSYFQRIWIVQECVLAKKLHFVCGLQYTSWKHLQECNRHIEHYAQRDLVGSLFTIKESFENKWYGIAIEKTMPTILIAARERLCSRFHDRIYGLLGILQPFFQTTGMVIDYTLSVEELMIKTQDFLRSGPGGEMAYTYESWILEIFRSGASREALERFVWYWQINGLLYNLDAEIIKVGLHALDTLTGERQRALIYQTICWIICGYGVNLFTPVETPTSPATTTTRQTFSFTCLKDPEAEVWRNQFFNMEWTYSTGGRSYCFSLTHRPDKSPYIPAAYDYVLTLSKSLECQALLEKHSKHVQSLARMRETFRDTSDLQTDSQLPLQVERMVFSNLLAQHAITNLHIVAWSNHFTRIDGLVRHIEPEGADFASFLESSLFSKYRMSVAGKLDALPEGALVSVEIEITESSGASQSADSGTTVLVAALYDEDA